MAYKIEESTLTSIHDAICIKRGKSSSYKIKGIDFDNEILEIDRMQKMYRFYTQIENGGRGMMVANVAGTYLWARVNGDETYVYQSSDCMFSGKSDGSKTRKVRDASGKAMIDCSTLVSLCLRDIPYSKSPYKHKGANATWNPSTELENMRGRDTFKILDRQPDGYHNNIGIDGYSTIRTAGDLAEFFYRTGCIVYDRDLDGAQTADWINAKLAPGDLLFWSSTTASDTEDGVTNQGKRFRHISHTAIVACESDKYIQAGSSNEKVVTWETMSDSNMTRLMFAIRPDYRAVERYANIPTNTNCLQFPWSWGVGATHTQYGLTCTMTGLSTMKITGTSTDAGRMNLRGDNSDSGDYLYLTPGTYEISGMNGSGIKSTSLALQVLTHGGSEIAGEYNGSATTSVRCYDGHDPVRFTLDSDKKVCVYLRCASGITVNANISPSLIRV